MCAARLPVQPLSRKDSGSGRSRGRDDRTLEYGKGIAGLVVIEHEHGRSSRKASLDVGRITGNPLQPGHVEAVSKVSRKRNDPAIRLGGEPQKVAIGIDALSIRVREICVADDLDTFAPMSADDIEHALAIDD